MSMLFSDLQSEVKDRSILDQGGTNFNTEIKNSINFSLMRIAREAPWKSLRRKTTFNSETSYTTGSGAVTVTEDSADVTITGATLITNGIQIGRRIDIGGSSTPYTIASITGETTLTVDPVYDGSSSTTQTYKIYGRREYNLPAQCGRIYCVWHEDYAYPYAMEYVTDWDFLKSGTTIETEGTPNYFMLWGEDNVLQQPIEASVMRIASSAAADTAIAVTVFGTVSGYPDYEIITTDGSDGTTAVSGSKSFTNIERVVKSASTTGRITVDCNATNVIVAVLPVGDTTGNIEYKKIQLYPIPDSVFPVNVYYYKDPWRLVNDGDIHELGSDFDEALILLSASKINYAQRILDAGDKFFGLYQDEIKVLRRKNIDKNLDWLPRMRRPKDSRRGSGQFFRGVTFNQLGGNYGPMSRI